MTGYIPDSDYGRMIRALNQAHYATEVPFYSSAGLRDCEETLVNYLPPGCRVADVGCGAGRVTKELAARGIEAVGVDINLAALRGGRSTASGIGIVNATMAALPVASEAFDRVWCLRFSFNALPARHERVDTLRELWRICAPGGVLVVEAFNWHFPGRLGLLRTANLLDAVSRRLRWQGQGRAGSPPLPDRDIIYLANKTSSAAPGYAHLTTTRELSDLALAAGLSRQLVVTNEAGVVSGDLRPVGHWHRGYATWLILSKPDRANVGGGRCG